MTAETVAQRLERWAAQRGERRALVFLENGEIEAGALSFAGLHAAALRIGAAIAGRGAAGHPVLILARQPRDFVLALFGCLAAGAIAVPCSVGPRGRGWDRILSIAADARPALAVGAGEGAEAMAQADAPAVPFLHLDECRAAPLSHPRAAANDWPALLQYTSGSTATPKGVVVTHGNLSANLAMLQAGFAVTEDSVYLNWLPLFHDMGLIGNLLAAIWSGVPCVLMSPLSFYQKPQRWLSAIHRYGATISGGPNFAYDLCLRRRERMDLAGLDLGCWRLAFCGAEPIRPDTLRGFAAAFARAGFRSSALFPCYGLAEATVFVSGSTSALDIRTMRGDAGRDVVGCGHAAPGSEILVVDPDTRRPVPDGAIGEIWIRGGHVAAGYWRQPDLTAPVFQARLEPDDGRSFLRTGDLGWLAENELYLKSRLKDLIIWQGANLHPEDIEATAAQSHPAFAATNAAFPVDGSEGEAVVVVQEVTRGALQAELSDAALRALCGGLAAAHGVHLHDALLVPPGSVPRTTSGKVQRRACRRLYEEGALAPLALARLRDAG